MPKFSFIARDKFGKKVMGNEEGANQDDIVSRLQGRDLVVISVNLAVEGADYLGGKHSATGISKRKHYGISAEDLVVFCRQLATLLGAGVSILKCLEIIGEQISSVKLTRVLKTLQKNMEAGLSLHEAMSKHPEVFSDLWVNLVESGEASGNLAVVLNRLASYLERNEAFKKKIVSALIYPAILLCAGTGALLFLTIKIIPTFATLFSSFNIKLPPLTMLLINVSIIIRKFGIFILLGLISVFFLVRFYIRTKEGRRQFESFQLKLPVFGEFFRATIVERFSSEMSTLIESGVPILYSLEITEHSVNSSLMADVIRRVKEDVRDGKPLSKPLSHSGFFEPMVIQMINIGEEIGELSQMFKRINTFYQEYVETFLTRFTSMFEPIMLIFMGLVIGIMVVGMFLPLFQIAQIGGG
ncbi:MAG: type II secretion system F family protein [Candidatus Omnitrophica bacterium]|nr:type II secretion system F family protein [Candidatus Omnitrophota bacterium]